MDKSKYTTLVAYALSMLALSEVINLNIVAVAIPNLMGALGANINDISLTMTSYMVAAAIFMPLSGMIINKFGMRRIALISTTIFTLFTVLCGMVTDLNQMIVFRTLQGVGGAFFPAMAQAYIANNFVQENRRKMMSVLTTFLVTGVIIGPSFGGFLVQNMSWNWIFYVNIPFLVFAFTIVFFFMEETKLVSVKIDYISFIFFMIGIGALEIFVDQGNEYMWFQSLYLTIVFAIAVLFLIYFFWRALKGYSVINFKVFRDRNFAICCFFLFTFYTVASAFMTYMPEVLQTIWGYQVDSAGYLLIPRGVFCFIFAPLVLKAARIFNVKLIIISACFAMALAPGIFCFINTKPDLIALFFSNILTAFASVAFTSTIYTIAYLKVPEELINEAAGVFNFCRTFGGSIGASITATIVTINQQISWNDLISHINRYSHSLKYLLPKVAGIMSTKTFLIINSWVIAQQSNLLAYIGVFTIFAICATILAIIPLFLESVPRGVEIKSGE